MRVDSWDEEEEQPLLPVAPRKADAATKAEPQSEEGAEAPELDSSESAAEERKLTLRQEVSAAPLWLWLIALLSIGSMCVMFFTIMSLIITR